MDILENGQGEHPWIRARQTGRPLVAPRFPLLITAFKQALPSRPDNSRLSTHQTFILKGML